MNKKIAVAFWLFVVCLLSSQGVEALPRHSFSARVMAPEVIYLNWSPIPSAVSYEVRLKDAHGVFFTRRDIFTVGCELTVKKHFGTLYWQVRPLDLSGHPLAGFSPWKRCREKTDERLLATGEYDKMPCMPVYPVYSWMPKDNATGYRIVVYYRPSSFSKYHLVRSYYKKAGYDYYDEKPLLQAGEYYWQGIALTEQGKMLGEWSKPQHFRVKTTGVQVAALGDSITHGGGAICTPPDFRLYDWESYSDVPILNIGYSGDTTSAMLRRFSHDVLTYKPRLLIIMGGINDLRVGVKAEQVISNLRQIRYLCWENGITPIFITVLPINSQKMERSIGITPAQQWPLEVGKVNDWIKQQHYYIDIFAKFTDKDGQLRADYTTDGLHPDAIGKRIIGEAVANYLRTTFPSIVQ